jgi:probable rRNA maturation factor
VDEGHLAIAFVSEDEIRALNREHRGRDEPTDVLAFPLDDREAVGPRELGDVFVCPERSHDVAEVVVHGVLHLCGMDHETDGGEMLALQDRIVAGL